MRIMQIWLNMRYRVQSMLMVISEITIELYCYHCHMVPKVLEHDAYCHMLALAQMIINIVLWILY